MKVVKNDKVKVISGNSKGKEGVVIAVKNSKNKILVEGVSMIKKHQKPTQTNQQGGIIEREAYIDASNVMIVCSHCKKAVRTGKSIVDGKSVRICRSCKKPL
jgi:large subunit ribosomal protein L24